MNKDDHHNTLSQLFEAAIALPSNQRASFLAAQCGSDTKLYNELQNLLSAHDSAGGFDALIADFAPIVGGLRKLNSDEGKRIGPYQIQSEIGRGGMAEVYKAQRIEDDLTGVVAIKVLHAGLENATFSDRFKRERKILAKLTHPNIAHFISAGQSDDKLLYLVLEYIDGQNLIEYCDAKQLTLKKRIGLMITIAETVEYAHQNLIVHRDLKPSNILITAKGEIKLLDFGIAKLLQPAGGPQINITQTAQQFFTPQYAAPEQITNKQITTATDIFALGIILYRLLTENFPWRVNQQELHAYKDAIVNQPAVLPSLQSALPPSQPSSLKPPPQLTNTKYNTALKGDLDAIMMKALSKKPNDRYRSARAFADDLKNYLAGRPVSARTQTIFYRTQKMIFRYPARAAGIALLVFSIIFGSLFTLNEAQKATAAQQEAQQQRLQSGAVAEMLEQLFHRIDPERTLGKDLKLVDLLEDARRRIENNPTLSPETKEMLYAVIRKTQLPNNNP